VEVGVRESRDGLSRHLAEVPRLATADVGGREVPRDASDRPDVHDRAAARVLHQRRAGLDAAKGPVTLISKTLFHSSMSTSGT